MCNGIQMALLLAGVFIGYLTIFAKFVFKLFVVAGIFWGFFLSLSQFPAVKISLWQSSLQAAQLSFWGATYFEWIASNWWQILAILVFFATNRISRSIHFISQTSGHAAFVASSIEKYLDIQAMTEKLQNLKNEPKTDTTTPLFEIFKYFVAMKKIAFFDTVFTSLSSVAFRVDDVIPYRDGKRADFRSDVEKILKQEPPSF